jgi:hypothetical protein
MKNTIILKLSLFIMAAYLFSTCGKLPVEESQDAYDATKVIPKVLGTQGTNLALQTKKYLYNVTYFRAGSTWNWSVTDAEIDSTSPDKRTVRVVFSTLPANDTALVKVSETTSGGTTSDVYVIKVKVNPFCPLINGLADLVGSWSGDDGYYPSVMTTTTDGTLLQATDMGVGFIEGFWGETVTTHGTLNISINDDGTVTIPRQYAFTTLYDGSNYDYEIM